MFCFLCRACPGLIRASSTTVLARSHFSFFLFEERSVGKMTRQPALSQLLVCVSPCLDRVSSTNFFSPQAYVKLNRSISFSHAISSWTPSFPPPKLITIYPAPFPCNTIAPFVATAEVIQAYVEIVNQAPAHTPGSPTEQAVLERQAEFDR